MGYYGSSWVLDSLSLSPLPYPVILIIAVASVFMVTSWYLSFEDAAESAGDHMNIALLLISLFLIVLVRWFSSLDNPDAFLGDDGGSSPWGVAGVILLLLVLLQYQSGFLEMWFPFG